MPWLQRPLLDLLADPVALDQTRFTQPVLFAVEWSLARLWQSFGVHPHVVLGHSLGEYVAATLAGVFSLADALLLVSQRGRLLEHTADQGAMLAVFAPEDQLLPVLADFLHDVSIAATNGPTETVLAGRVEAIAAVQQRLQTTGLKTRSLKGRYAFHSPLVEPILDEFQAIASRITYAPPRLALIANLTGQLSDGQDVTTSAYWRQQIRQPVRFGAGLQTAIDQGCQVLLEVGPGATLVGLGRRMLADATELTWLTSLRADHDDWQQVLESVGELYVRGVTPDWTALEHGQPPRRRVRLPSYPFQRSRYWLDTRDSQTTSIPPAPVLRDASEQDCLYEIRWQAEPRKPAAPAFAEPGQWLLVADTAGLASELGAELTRRGEVARLVVASDHYARDASGWHVDPTCPEHFHQLLSEAIQEPTGRPLRAVLDLSRGLPGALHMAQALASSHTSGRLWLVTCGAVATGEPSETLDVAQAPLWGLGRTLALEQAQHWGGLIDLDPALREADTERLLAEVATAGGEREVAFRHAQRYVPRLVPLASKTPAPAVRIRSDATYLITGGLGGLGLVLAEWLVAQGARYLALLGRRAPTAEAEARLARLRAKDATILSLQADVADIDQLSAALERLDGEVPPLRGIFHAAGTVEDAALANQAWSGFARVMAPKVDGARNLHQLTRERPLDLFVLFSSAAALLGSPGQVNYAAANAFLDALAHQRRAESLPALSINWGPWTVGMASSAAESRRWIDWGVRPIEGDLALRLLGQVFAQIRVAQVAVLPVDWQSFARRCPPGAEPPLVADLVHRARPSGPPPNAAGHSRLPTRIAAALPVARRELLLEFLRVELGVVLGLDAAAPFDERQGLFELGMDSLMAVELRNRLQAAVEGTLSLPPTFVFEHPTLEAIANYLVDALLQVEPPAREVVTPRETTDPIAIVGLACRFPGASHPAAFWDLLREGVDAIREVPPDRWNVHLYYDPDPTAAGKTYSRWGSFVDQVDRFDAQFFRIAPREVASMDPQQRLLLEVTWEALEYAGQSADNLVGSRAGVFVGISSNDYAQLAIQSQDLTQVDAYSGTGNTPSAAAGRLSYVFGLQGPSMSIDTACSSSLVALHLGCQSLRQGESDLALAAGVGLVLAPAAGIFLSRARALAADGRCKTFDAAADGYVRGEGCGVVVLKRLFDALRDGDRVLALVRGSAVNQDGRSAGFTVPNGLAQEAVIKAALAQAGVAPHQIGYVEAHGTGTPLGDPIELRALGSVLGQERAAGRPLMVGSVKTNLGHLEAAAGVAGLIKTVLMLQHGQIPPHLHFSQPSPYIEWDKLAVEIPTQLRAWPVDAGQRRLAGVSAFGLSGTNAHVILEEAPPAVAELVAPPHVDAVPHVLPLSARSPAALRTLAEAYANLLARTDAPSLHDVCYTAARRRTHHEYRRAFVGSSPGELVAQLSAESAPPAAQVFAGQRPRVAFVFPGQGGQWPGMARDLLAREPVFLEALQQCQAALQPHVSWDLLEVLRSARPLEAIDELQPVLFSLQVALATLWRSWGIVPDAVV
ncbi:MAG TPA: SDR family NAD(P)-dependent oxidoreductase, partial [Chloroflexota bacterium]